MFLSTWHIRLLQFSSYTVLPINVAHLKTAVFYTVLLLCGGLGSRVVIVLDSGAEGPGFKSQSWCCRVTVLGKLFTPILPLFTKQQNMVAVLLRVAGVTAGLAESNVSLPSGLWFTLPAGWLPRTWISSGILRLVIEYGLPSPFTYSNV